jgi:O-antigen/teichoic acid export membrane protein
MRRTSDERSPGDKPRRLQAGRLVQNAVALMVSAGGSAMLGVVFWGVSAHLASASVVGRTSAEIAAMTLLATLSQLSFGSIFERFLPVAGAETRAFVKRAYSMCVVFAFFIASIYVFTGLGHSSMPNGIWWHLFFIAIVMLWTIFILQDSVMIGLRASRWVPVENISFAIIKLSLLPILLSVTSSQGVFLAYSIPVVIIIVVVSRYLFTRRIPEHELQPAHREQLPKTRELFLLAGAQYATLLFSVFTPSVVTLIVISRLGAVANAHFYVPALIVSGLSLFNLSIVRSFMVEAASEPYALRRHTNVAIMTMTAVLEPAVIIGCVFAPEFLRIFGASYAEHGTALLRMMLIALPLSGVSIFYSAFAWLDRRVWWMAARDVASAIIYFAIVLSLIGRLGIDSIGIASLVSAGLQTLFFLPTSIHRYRQTTNSDPPPAPIIAT